MLDTLCFLLGRAMLHPSCLAGRQARLTAQHAPLRIDFGPRQSRRGETTSKATPRTLDAGDIELVAAEPMFDVFLSHNWGEDAQGRDNHASAWVDKEQLENTIVPELADGIERSRVFLICMTKKYHNKVNCGPPNDHCRLEFQYARQKRCDRLVVCIMESGMKDTSQWNGQVGMTCGGILYIDLSGDDWSDDQKK
eukprot:1352625-Amphidinium_carterae.1